MLIAVLDADVLFPMVATSNIRDFAALPSGIVAAPADLAVRPAYAADLFPRVLRGAISASAGMFHFPCSFQAISIVRERFLVSMSEARCREPSRRPRSAWV